MAEVRMPKLGESVTEGTLGKWLKNVGDAVSKYEPLVEVVTDKVTAEIPSDEEGILIEIAVAEGETVRVGTVLAYIEQSRPASEQQPVLVESNQQHKAIEPLTTKQRYSPAVRYLAQKHAVDLQTLSGTGFAGRITRKDVLASLQTVNEQKETDKPLLPPTEEKHDIQTIAITPIRKTIATRMTESARDVPHAWMMVEADVTKLVKVRERNKKSFKEREGIDLTYFPFFMKVVVDALKEYPMLNSTWTNDGILVHQGIHLSVAVATEDALVVPVIHHADRLSISGLAHALSAIATRAKTGKLTLDDVSGGTFTINNTGAFGSVLSKPILNPPQAGILSIESIIKRPVVLADDAIAIRSMVNLCISIDHRVLDGLITGRFMKLIKGKLEAFDVTMDV
nr:2-oxo acid dehydrogenase subunit E2 [Bacilli bacterium]